MIMNIDGYTVLISKKTIDAVFDYQAIRMSVVACCLGSESQKIVLKNCLDEMCESIWTDYVLAIGRTSDEQYERCMREVEWFTSHNKYIDELIKVVMTT